MRWTKNPHLAKFAVLTADVHGHSLYVPGGKAGHQDGESLPHRGRDRFCQSDVRICESWTRGEFASAVQRRDRPPHGGIWNGKLGNSALKSQLLKDRQRQRKVTDRTSRQCQHSAQNNLVSSAAGTSVHLHVLLPRWPGYSDRPRLSGFVDVYYGQNFNNPASQTNGLRFFDEGTNQFGLNLVELVVDKAPEVS